MYIDAFNLFSGALSAAGVLSGQAIAASPTVSTNSYDTGPRALGSNQAVGLGNGHPLLVSISVLVAPTVATSVEFQLIQADDAALTTNVEVLQSSGAIAIAQLPLKAMVELAFVGSNLASRRYVGVRYVVVGTATTAGTYAAGVVADRQDVKNTIYKSGYLVS